MLSNLKYLLVVLLACLLLSSCFTIEKRLYRGGYYVNKNATPSTKHREYAVMADSLPASPALAQVVSDVPDLKIIPSGKPVVFSRNYLLVDRNLQEDTLPPKKTEKDHGPEKFDEEKDVTKRERKIPGSVIIGLILGVISFSCLTWIAMIEPLGGFIVAGLISSVVGMVFSLIGLGKINGKADKDGRGLVLAGIYINGLFIALALLVVGYWIYMY